MRRDGQVPFSRRDSGPRARRGSTRRDDGGDGDGAVGLLLGALTQDAALLDGVCSDERGGGRVEGRGAGVCAFCVFECLAGEGLEGDARGAEEFETADGFQLWVCVSGGSLSGCGVRRGNIPLTTSFSVSMVNSSNEMGWRQSVVLSVTVAAEVAEMSAARAAVTVKVFIVIEVDVCYKSRSKSLKQLKYVELIFA